jgi:hypothetical protein
MNAWLAKPIPLGLVYGGPGGAFRQRLPLKKCLSASRGWFSCSFWTTEDHGTRHWVATSIPARKFFFCGAQSNQAAGKAFSGHADACPKQAEHIARGVLQAGRQPQSAWSLRVEFEKPTSDAATGISFATALLHPLRVAGNADPLIR